jgi:hypothetical protein
LLRFGMVTAPLNNPSALGSRTKIQGCPVANAESDALSVALRRQVALDDSYIAALR